MFSQIKLWIGVAITSVVGVLFALLKIKSSQLDTAKERIAIQKQELKLERAEDKVSDEVRASLREKEQEIEDYYEELQFKAIKSADDKPLDDDLLDLLHNRRKSKPDKKTSS